MASFTLGQAAIANKGAWSNATTYNILNTVTHNGGTFMCIAQNSNKEPGVTSGWASYWVATAKGIKTVAVTALNSSQASVTITLSDGTTIAAGTYATTAVADGSITDAKIASAGISKIANGAVTAAKLGADILPANVGILSGTATPTTSTISNGQVYLKYA